MILGLIVLAANSSLLDAINAGTILWVSTSKHGTLEFAA